MARLSSLVFFLVITQPVFGQIHVGLTAGANFATVSTDYDEGEHDGRVLLALGGVLEIGLNDRFSLRIEPMYLQKGVESRFTGNFFPDGNGIKYENRVDYLELPILISYSFPVTESLTPFITMGPSIGFKLGADFGTVRPGGVGGQIYGDISKEIKLIDMGLAVGTGVQFRSRHGWFFVETRYTLGLTNFYDIRGGDFWKDCCSQPVELSNRGLQVLTGYIFPL